MVCADQNRYHRDDHGSTLADHKPHHGKADRRSKAVPQTDKVNQVDASHAADLFCQLREGGDGGFPDSEKIAVDAGMHAGHGNGEGNDTKQRSSTFFQQKGHGDLICVQIDRGCAGCGEKHSEKEACPEGAKGIFVVTGARLACHIFGDGCLDA